MRRCRNRPGRPAPAFPGAHFALRLGHAGQFQAEADVGQHVLPGQQGVVLEHHAAFGAGALDRGTVQGDAPGAGSTKPAIRFNSEVLPLPDGPRATSNCWGPRFSEMSASTGSVAPGYCALMRSSCSKAIAMNS
jgi:hypothetical protein